MKKIFFAVLFSFLTANACPELSGNYTCGFDQENGEPNVLQIRQQDPITFKILQFGSDQVLTYTANNQPLTLDDENSLTTYLTNCPDGTNALQFKANIFHKTENWTQRISSTYVKTEPDKIDFIVELFINKKDSETLFSTTFHCKRN